MSGHDLTYAMALKRVLSQGSPRGDRTGTGTISTFGEQAYYHFEDGFPLLTTKKVYWKGVVHELLWFLSGDTNTDYLQDNDVHIWDEWADASGNLGPVYGAQWRDFNGVDQIAELMDNLRKDPYSRRHIVSAWNPSVLPDTSQTPRENAENGLQALPPCHTLFQFYVEDIEGKQYLSCQLYQRSGDMFLGVPFNIASYSLLTAMIAHQLDMEPGKFIHTLGDAHIYNNHVDQVNEQLERPWDIPAPTIKFNRKPDSIFDYKFEDIELVNYEPLPAIKAPISV